MAQMIYRHQAQDCLQMINKKICRTAGRQAAVDCERGMGVHGPEGSLECSMAMASASLAFPASMDWWMDHSGVQNRHHHGHDSSGHQQGGADDSAGQQNQTHAAEQRLHAGDGARAAMRNGQVATALR